MELEEIKNNALQKIGRNILLFQEMEHLVKFLVFTGKMEGFTSEFEANQKKRGEAIHKQTLGKVVGQYIENPNSEENEAEFREGYVSFTLELSDAYYERKKETFASLVAERNDLVHHLLPRLNPDSAENWIEVERYLDNQHEKLLPELDELRGILNKFQEIRKEAAEFWASDEGKRQWELLWSRQSQ